MREGNSCKKWFLLIYTIRKILLDFVVSISFIKYKNLFQKILKF